MSYAELHGHLSVISRHARSLSDAVNFEENFPQITSILGVTASTSTVMFLSVQFGCLFISPNEGTGTPPSDIVMTCACV